MKSQTLLVRANQHTQQIITCSITDQLLINFPVSVIFFYSKSINCNLLVEALKKVLSDFPIFAGTLTNIDNNLCIDCNNQGVLFSVKKANLTLEQILHQPQIIKTDKLINIVEPKKTISNQSPIMIIKLTYVSCGGMALGVSWHHSIGDMHTFMCLMKAWSSTVNKKEYDLPLIITERDKYLEANLENKENITPDVRYLSTKELVKLGFYLLFSARNKLWLQIYFSEDELKNMKQDFLAKTKQNLSTNDVLCAYLFSIIAELDSHKEAKKLSIAVNYRPRINLPQNLLGNFISLMTVISNQDLEPFQFAKSLRASVNNFQHQHLNLWATKKYIEQNGGTKKIARFISRSIDPTTRNLLITNWAKSGVYDITFGESKPIYFTPFGDPPFPWLSVIVEGFLNKGLIYSAVLPRKLAKKLMEKDILNKIHQYREQKEVMPELIAQLRWLL